MSEIDRLTDLKQWRDAWGEYKDENSLAGDNYRLIDWAIQQIEALEAENFRLRREQGWMKCPNCKRGIFCHFADNKCPYCGQSLQTKEALEQMPKPTSDIQDFGLHSSSIDHNIVIDNKEDAERLVNALEQAEQCKLTSLIDELAAKCVHFSAEDEAEANRKFDEQCIKTGINIMDFDKSQTPQTDGCDWLPVTNGRGGHECSNCREYAPSYQSGEEYLSNFCPNCGKRLQKEGE
jgi:hypothetical protein